MPEYTSFSQNTIPLRPLFNINSKLRFDYRVQQCIDWKKTTFNWMGSGNIVGNYKQNGNDFP
jgi:hypothetical protein